MNYQHKAIELNLTCIRIEALRIANLFNQVNWKKPIAIVETDYEFYLRTKGIDWVRAFYRPSQEGERIRSDLELYSFDFQAEDSFLPEYPFQNFNYGP